MLAAAYGTLGKAELAQAALDAALAADPNYAPALLVSARQKAAARDFDGALAIADDVHRHGEPRNTDAWKLKGDILLYAKSSSKRRLPPIANRSRPTSRLPSRPMWPSWTLLIQQGQAG